MLRTFDLFRARSRAAICLDLEAFQTKNVDGFVDQVVCDRTALVANRQRHVDPPVAPRKPTKDSFTTPAYPKRMTRKAIRNSHVSGSALDPLLLRSTRSIDNLFGFIVIESFALAAFVRSRIVAPLRPAHCAPLARRRVVKPRHTTWSIPIPHGLAVGNQPSEMHP
jgi:hypothetical protein